MTDDIVNKLQTLCHPASEFLPDGKRLTLFIQHSKEAADEIARLRGEVERLTRERDEAQEAASVLRVVSDGTVARLEEVDEERDAALARAEAAERERDYWARARNEWEKLAYMTVQRDQWRGTCASHSSRAEAAERERDWHKSLTQSHDLLADNAALKARADAAEAKVAKLREALKPFAEALEGNFAEQEEDHVDLWESPAASVVTYGDLRRARTALQETEQ